MFSLREIAEWKITKVGRRGVFPMKLLLHTCCAPCLLYPITVLREDNFDITGYFYNPNIHPFQEFKRRRDTLASLAKNDNLKIVIERDYGLHKWMRQIAFHEENRCSICYDMRLQQSAEYAVNNGYDAFSTTLLYSKYQYHSTIVGKCHILAQKYGIEFIYRDFRIGWQKGIDWSIAKKLYRQPYCGCLFSEHERYDNREKKRLRKLAKRNKK